MKKTILLLLITSYASTRSSAEPQQNTQRTPILSTLSLKNKKPRRFTSRSAPSFDQFNKYRNENPDGPFANTNLKSSSANFVPSLSPIPENSPEHSPEHSPEDEANENLPNSPKSLSNPNTPREEVREACSSCILENE